MSRTEVERVVCFIALIGLLLLTGFVSAQFGGY